MSLRISFNYRAGIRVGAFGASGLSRRISSRYIENTGTPNADVQNYWVNDAGSEVVTDDGQLTVIDDVIFYWSADDGSLVCDDAGQTVELLHINN